MSFEVSLVIFILVFVILWLIARFVVGEPAPVEAPAPDDLASLEGIGPKVNQILQAAGITTFAQLAKANVEHLNELLEANDLQFMDPAYWPEQARLLVEGKAEELAELQEKLKGGRMVEE